MAVGSALIADGDYQHTQELSEQFEKAGWQLHIVDSISKLQTILGKRQFNLAIVALDISGEPCEETFEQGLYQNVDEVIVMSEHDDPTRVRRIMRHGASYFFCKPFDSVFFDELISDLSADLDREQNPEDDGFACAVDQFGEMRGSSRPMQRMFRIIRKVAPTDASVLLIGESGTGKELAARTLHQMSNRSDAPLVAMNCGAIPSELVESELFGHVKGAFTGAEKTHRGFFERANQATLFLDEITEMPLEIQVKLLRVLETGRFRKVGGEQDLESDVRIIAATNRDPQTAVDEGVLREDLYYRIASFPITLPPLRKRHGDVAGLAQYFLSELNDAGDTQVTLTRAALERLNEYPWPGNVRELKSAVERAYVLSAGTIDAEQLHLGDEPAAADSDDDELTLQVGMSIRDAERDLILATLESLDGDKQAAADTLGISLKTLYNRLNEYEA